jgi:hypothetical protein
VVRCRLYTFPRALIIGVAIARARETVKEIKKQRLIDGPLPMVAARCVAVNA